jgi:hypothetical protein
MISLTVSLARTPYWSISLSGWLNITAEVITSIVGVVLNIISLFFFYRKEFNTPLYEFLRAYCFVGMLTCAISVTFPFSTTGTCASPRRPPWPDKPT